MTRCDVCGRRLNLREAFRSAVTRNASYPFVTMDGARKEQHVRSLCGRCAKRAHLHRQPPSAGPDAAEPGAGAEPVLSGKVL